MLGRCNKLSDDRNVESPVENIFMSLNFLHSAINIFMSYDGIATRSPQRLGWSDQPGEGTRRAQCLSAPCWTNNSFFCKKTHFFSNRGSSKVTRKRVKYLYTWWWSWCHCREPSRQSCRSRCTACRGCSRSRLVEYYIIVLWSLWSSYYYRHSIMQGMHPV